MGLSEKKNHWLITISPYDWASHRHPLSGALSLSSLLLDLQQSGGQQREAHGLSNGKPVVGHGQSWSLTHSILCTQNIMRRTKMQNFCKYRFI